MTARRWGRVALALWSVTVAGTHGAASMLVPLLMPICRADASARPVTGSGVLLLALAAVGAHSAVMLIVTGAVAAGASVGVAALRRPLQRFLAAGVAFGRRIALSPMRIR